MKILLVFMLNINTLILVESSSLVSKFERLLIPAGAWEAKEEYSRQAAVETTCASWAHKFRLLAYSYKYDKSSKACQVGAVDSTLIGDGSSGDTAIMHKIGAIT